MPALGCRRRPDRVVDAEQYLTGSISASPQRQWILQSVLAVRSESLLTEDDESGEADGESAESEPGDDA